jgi:sphingomyelin phosphodiesterase
MRPDSVQVVDDDVCEGAVGQQAPVLAHNLRSINPLGQTATKLCDSLLGLCQQPKVNAYNVPFAKPAPASYTKPQAGKKAPFQVVHFSDIHIDRQYTVRTTLFFKVTDSTEQVWLVGRS